MNRNKINRLRFSRLLAVALLVLVAAVLAPGAGAATHKGATLKLRQSAFGPIIVDARGRTLYMTSHDRRSRSTCYGACAKAWPPLVTRAKPRATMGARGALLGSSMRKDGRRQVTYRGHPLYFFSGDRRAGQAGGAGLMAFGGRWDPLSASGIAAKRPAFERPKVKHGLLAVVGTDNAEKIALRLNAGDADTLQVDVGDDGSAEFSFKRKKVTRIAVDARAGDDVVRMDEANGAFTTAIPTTIDAGAGNDTVLGGAGAETLLSGDGNDLVDGNGGNDRALLGAGDDVFVWDPGDGSDTIEGEAGADTMRFNGANIAEQVDLSANGNRLRFFRVQANITIDTAGVERVDFNALGGADLVTVNNLAGTDVASVNVDLAGSLGAIVGDGSNDHVVVNGTAGNDTIDVSGNASAVNVAGLRTAVAIQHQEPADELAVNGLGGNDHISATALAAGAISLTLDGGEGDDTIAGSPGVELMLGGAGNDLVDGNGGNDRALLGAGDDVFVWDPGDGSDTIEGEAGADTMRFNGASIAEQVDLSANGNRLRFFRVQANITMDTAGVERVYFNALGGADLVTVNNLAGTDVASVNVDLAGSLGATAGDGSTDRVVVNGSKLDDQIRVGQDASGVNVSGLRAAVSIRHAEPNDALIVDALGGRDDVSAAGLPAQAVSLTLDGDIGDDELFGGLGNDRLQGGDENDVLDGSKGNDVALMGAGDDLFEWDPGDGSDVVEGEDGNDSMLFIGANLDEQFHVTASGNRVRFARDVGNVTMDLAGLEEVDLQALGGADLVDVGDLTGTDLASLQVDLEGAPGAGDGAKDRVVVAGTDGDDRITVNGDAGGVKVSGLHTGIKILQPEFENDRLEVNTGAGRDQVDASELAPETIQLFVNGLPFP